MPETQPLQRKVRSAASNRSHAVFKKVLTQRRNHCLDARAVSIGRRSRGMLGITSRTMPSKPADQLARPLCGCGCVMRQYGVHIARRREALHTSHGEARNSTATLVDRTRDLPREPTQLHMRLWEAVGTHPKTTQPIHALVPAGLAGLSSGSACSTAQHGSCCPPRMQPAPWHAAILRVAQVS